MLRILAATLVTLTMGLASASTMTSAMRDMGKAFKKINQTIHDSSENQNNAVLAQTVAQLLTQVVNEMPSTVSELPSGQQEAMARYQDLIQQEIVLAQQLEQAFLNNDNATAQVLFQQMSDLMDQGHDEFEPQ